MSVGHKEAYFMDTLKYDLNLHVLIDHTAPIFAFVNLADDTLSSFRIWYTQDCFQYGSFMQMSSYFDMLTALRLISCTILYYLYKTFKLLDKYVFKMTEKNEYGGQDGCQMKILPSTM